MGATHYLPTRRILQVLFHASRAWCLPVLVQREQEMERWGVSKIPNPNREWDRNYLNGFDQHIFASFVSVMFQSATVKHIEIPTSSWNSKNFFHRRECQLINELSYRMGREPIVMNGLLALFLWPKIDVYFTPTKRVVISPCRDVRW